jgi:hypothetical protein
MAGAAPLTLSEALKTGRIDDFVAQAEAAGVGATTQKEFDTAIEVLVTPRRLSGRTSRSASRGGSTEK